MANDNGVVRPYSQEHILNQSFDRDFQQLMVEMLGYDGNGLQRANADNLATKLDYDGGTTPIYIGLATPGSASNEAKWLIKKFTWDGDNPTDIQFANGSPNFNQVWADRASLSYS